MARRLTMIVVSVISVIACCALAWWQLQRYESSSGTWQNLGYVLQWPLFGLFPAFVFLRMRRLHRQRAADEGHFVDEVPADAGPEGVVNDAFTAPDAGKASFTAPADAPAEADDELAAYNRYLAELHARDQEGSPPA